MWCLRLCLKNSTTVSSKGHLTQIPGIPEGIVNSSKLTGMKKSTKFTNYLKKCFSQLSSEVERENIPQNVPKNVPSNGMEGDSPVGGTKEGKTDVKDTKLEEKKNLDIRQITKAFLDLWNLNTQGPGCALVLIKFLRIKVEEGNWTEREEADSGGGGGGGVKEVDVKVGGGLEEEVLGKGKGEGEGDRQGGWKGEGVGEEGGSTAPTSASVSVSIPVSPTTSVSVPRPVTLSNPVSDSVSVSLDGVSAVIVALLGSLSLCPVTTHPRLLFVISWLLRPSHADTDMDRDTERGHAIDHSKEGKKGLRGKDEREILKEKEENASKYAPTESLVLDLFAIDPYRGNRTNIKSVNSAEFERVLSCVVDWLNVRVASLLRVEGRLTHAILMRKGTALSLLIAEASLSLY